MDANTMWRDKMLDEKHYVGSFHRLLAFVYNLIANVFTFLVVGSLTSWWMVLQSEAPSEGTMGVNPDYIWEHEFHLLLINWSIIAVVLLFQQYIVPVFKRQTIGMNMLGLYLNDENAEEITKKQYIKRELYKLILFPTILRMMIRKEKRPSYDRKANVFLLH